MMRKAASSSRPDFYIEQNGDDFVIKMVTMFMTIEDKFTLGKVFDKKEPSGNMMDVSKEDPKKCPGFRPTLPDSLQQPNDTS